MCDANAARHFEYFVKRVGPRVGLLPSGDRASVPEPRLKMLPLAPLAKTYTDRVLAVGDAAGLVKATTGGGIYYSLLSAGLAADTLAGALARDSLGETQLAPYERAWQKRLGPELEAQLSLRLLANRLSDEEIDSLFELARTDGVMPIVRRTARFNRHRDLILSLFKHPPVRRILFNRLAGRSVATL
jgi:flavin-dependent dehydrogenase